MSEADTFHARHDGLFDPDALNRKSVLLVGAGSVGSVLGALLARSGVRGFALYDPDSVSEANLCRTVYVQRDVGRPKVEALADHLRAIRGGIEVEAHVRSLRDLEDAEVMDAIDDADLVVAVTDHPPTQARLGFLSYHTKPAVFAGVYAKGTGGEVLWTSPEETPCYACVLGSVRGADAPPRGKTDYGLATGKLAAEPALGVDIAAVTVRAAKIALALLLRGTGSPVADLVDPRQSILFVGNAVEWIWQEPFEVVWARAERRTDCVCRIRPGQSTASLLRAS